MHPPLAIDPGNPVSNRVRASRAATCLSSPVAGRLLLFATTVTFLLFATFVFVAVYSGATSRGEVGYDAEFYAALGQRFIDTGVLYSPSQFAGPYLGEGFVNLYPPFTMYLFLPFTVLPTPLWWAAPLGVLVWHIWLCRPARWSWPVMALLLATVPASASLIYGNTALWSAAAIALACRWPTAGALLLLKPTDLIAGVLFARRRSFWLGAIVMVFAALPFGTAWVDYLTVLGNIEGGSVLRNVPSLAIFAIPIVAWGARSRGRLQDGRHPSRWGSLLSRIERQARKSRPSAVSTHPSGVT